MTKYLNMSTCMSMSMCMSLFVYICGTYAKNETDSQRLDKTNLSGPTVCRLSSSTLEKKLKVQSTALTQRKSILLKF